MNATSLTIKYTFTYSKQTVFFLDVQIYLSESRKFKTKLYKNQPAAWHYFTSTLTIHSAVKKVSFILWYYLVISEDHILQEELYNLTHILLACAYLLHLIIKNTKKALTHNCNYLLSQRTPQTETNILPIVTPFSDISKLFAATYIRIGTQLPMTPYSPPFGHPNPSKAYTKSSSIPGLTRSSMQN